MDTHHDPQPNRSLDPNVDLRTIPSGWDLSEFYSPTRWVNEPQSFKQPPSALRDIVETPHDASEDAV
jgi:hypothetical protein